MSAEKPHGATPIHPSKGKGGGGSKWVAVTLAAAVLIGGGYLAWQYWPSQANTETAANDALASDPLAAESYDATPPDDVTSDDAAIVAPASQPAAPARRARAAPVPEETIGVTPASATVTESAGVESDEIVVTAHRPVWTSRPSPRRLSAMYPQRALERGREGEARLACVVQERGVLDCDQIEATPGGFGRAAERVAGAYRHAATLSNGESAVGTPVNLRVVFRMSDEERRGRG